MVSTDTNGTLILWDVSSGEKRLSIEDAHGSAAISVVEFSHLDARIVTGVCGDFTLACLIISNFNFTIDRNSVH